MVGFLFIILPSLIYLAIGILPAVWYFSSKQASRWYLVAPLIAMGLLHLLPPALLGIREITPLFGLYMHNELLFWTLITIFIPSSIVAFGLIVYNPKPKPKYRAFRILGIICLYLAYLIAGPWWAVTFM